jgi:hypothetical protein
MSGTREMHHFSSVAMRDETGTVFSSQVPTSQRVVVDDILNLLQVGHQRDIDVDIIRGIFPSLPTNSPTATSVDEEREGVEAIGTNSPTTAQSRHDPEQRPNVGPEPLSQHAHDDAFPPAVTISHNRQIGKYWLPIPNNRVTSLKWVSTDEVEIVAVNRIGVISTHFPSVMTTKTSNVPWQMALVGPGGVRIPFAPHSMRIGSKDNVVLVKVVDATDLSNEIVKQFGTAQDLVNSVSSGRPVSIECKYDTPCTATVAVQWIASASSAWLKTNHSTTIQSFACQVSASVPSKIEFLLVGKDDSLIRLSGTLMDSLIGPVHNGLGIMTSSEPSLMTMKCGCATSVHVDSMLLALAGGTLNEPSLAVLAGCGYVIDPDTQSPKTGREMLSEAFPDVEFEPVIGDVNTPCADMVPRFGVERRYQLKLKNTARRFNLMSSFNTTALNANHAVAVISTMKVGETAFLDTHVNNTPAVARELLKASVTYPQCTSVKDVVWGGRNSGVLFSPEMALAMNATGVIRNGAIVVRPDGQSAISDLLAAPVGLIITTDTSSFDDAKAMIACGIGTNVGVTGIINDCKHVKMSPIPTKGTGETTTTIKLKFFNAMGEMLSFPSAGPMRITGRVNVPLDVTETSQELESQHCRATKSVGPKPRRVQWD